MNELHRPYTRIYRVRTQAVPVDRSRATWSDVREITVGTFVLSLCFLALVLALFVAAGAAA